MNLTQNKESVLSNIIIQNIQQQGPISFRNFMEMSLYYPDLGYYTTVQDKIGTKGDFYTSSTVSPAFGAMIARQLEEMWHLLGEHFFTIVEYGGGTGALCYDILEYLSRNEKLYAGIRYCIIEKSPSMRARQKLYLLDKVYWYDSIKEIGDIQGCVLSNEVIDNLSVHQVVMEDELMEVWVDYDTDYKEILKPASSILIAYLEQLKIVLPKGFRTEINIEATEWIRDLADQLSKGFVITIDYGHSSIDLYHNSRSSGTLLCFSKHTINEDPYKNIGEQDITTHVNFSALCLWGHKNGLAYCGFTTQQNFLLNLGFIEYIKQAAVAGQESQNHAKEIFLIETLIIEMGNKFKVLIQHKNIPNQQLKGLKQHASSMP